MARVVLNNRSAEVALLDLAQGLIILHVGKSWLASCDNAFSGWACCSEVRPLRQGDFPAQAGVPRGETGSKEQSGTESVWRSISGD